MPRRGAGPGGRQRRAAPIAPSLLLLRGRRGALAVDVGLKSKVSAVAALRCGQKRRAGTALPLNGPACSGPGLPAARAGALPGQASPGPAAERREGPLPVRKGPVPALRGARPQTGPGAARVPAHGKRPSP